MSTTTPSKRLRQIAEELYRLADDLEPAPPQLPPGPTAEIELREGHKLIVPAACFAQMSAWNWTPVAQGASHRRYAIRSVSRNGRQVSIKAHREVLRLSGVDLPAGRRVMFRDGNGLNCELSNLIY